MSAEERWTQRKEWEAEPHDLYCNCESCHEEHIKNGDIGENAKLIDFECCKIEVQYLIDKGDWCPVNKHGDAYMENGKCNECLDTMELFQDEGIKRAQHS